MNEFDARSLLGEEGPTTGRPRRQSKAKQPRYGDAQTYPRLPRESRPQKSEGIYDHLATVFRDTDTYVSQGATLVATLLRRRVEADASLCVRMGTDKPRDAHVVQDLVEYMIKRFWAEVPNDERGNALSNFLRDDWWVRLADESINHYRLLRMDKAPGTVSGPALLDNDPFYAEFIRPEKPRVNGTLSERLAAARIHHEQESN